MPIVPSEMAILGFKVRIYLSLCFQIFTSDKDAVTNAKVHEKNYCEHMEIEGKIHNGFRFKQRGLKYQQGFCVNWDKEMSNIIHDFIMITVTA